MLFPPNSPLWHLYDLVAGIFIVIDIFLVGGFIYAFYKGWRMRPSFNMMKIPAEKKIKTLRDAVLKERWNAVVRKFSTGAPESMRLAVIEADALVDSALKGMEIEGEHLADRLSNLEEDEMKSIQGVWRAHRMRNDLVHTPGFSLSQNDAKSALDNYEAFLKEIEVL